MKKTLSILMALVMILALAIPAFAADENIAENGTGEDSAEVKATYEELETSDDVDTVYLVTIAWDVDSTITYSEGTQTYTWNAADTQYETNPIQGTGWSGNAEVTITVTNKSNAEVDAETEWKAAADIDVDCVIVGEEVTVKSAAEDTDIKADKLDGEAQTETITATVDTPTSGSITENNATVGTLTVSITPTPED